MRLKWAPGGPRRVTPFQATGIELDHAVPLTIEDARALGLEEALARVRRTRFAKALQVLGAPKGDLDAFVALADDADSAEEVAARAR